MRHPIEVYTAGELRAMRRNVPYVSIVIRYSDEDRGYIATAANFPGCSAWGKTRADAAREMDDAIEAWLRSQEALVSAGYRKKPEEP